MISIKKLTRNYGPVVAVDDLSLEISSGEVVGLLGHNGAGKTTVMKLLTGFLEPTAGSVSVGGIDTQADLAAVQAQIGYLPENAPLYPEMHVQAYLLMMAELRGISADDLERAVADAVVATGLTQHLASPIHTLSKGYRQRVGIAQAIIHRPDVLVLDEPTNGLDPVQIQSIRDLILKLAKNTTIILSTHILQEIEAVCDRVLVMIEGRLSADGSLHDLLSSVHVSLSLDSGDAGEAEVIAQLTSVDGISSAVPKGEDPDNAGFALWQLGCEARVIPALIDSLRDRSWAVGWVAPLRQTLESYFQQLQEQHIAARPAPAESGGPS